MSCKVRKRWVLVAISLACLALIGCSAIHEERSIHIDGREYRSLRSISEHYGAELGGISDKDEVELRGDFGGIDFRGASREIQLNELRVFLGDAILKRNNSLYVSLSDIQKFIEPLMEPASFAPFPSVKTIVIDAGHGGHDVGTQNKKLGLDEKNLTLDVIRYLEILLEEKGYAVILTRNEDRYLGLEERTEIARNQKADLFLSVHFNAAANLEASGTETYILTPQYQRSTGSSEMTENDAVELAGNHWDPWNAAVGFYIHRQLVYDLKGDDRGLKRARFAVLRNLDCPGVLIEAAFLSNAEEANRVKTVAFQKRLAHSIATGVEVYERMLKRTKNEVAQ
jgi:N-acetylmuramoyl-L-alanine amidase